MNHSQTGPVAVGGVRLLLSALTMAVAAAGCGDDDNNPNAPTNTVGRIQLTASQASLPGQGGDSDITATVFSGAGAPIAAVEVAFTTTSGTLSASAATTDASGIARVKLSTTSSATVKATARGVASPDLAIGVKQLAEVRVNVRGDAFSTEATTLEITAKRGGSDVSGQLTVDYGDGTERGEGDINGGKELRYTYGRPGDYNVTATVQESDGTRSHETSRLAVAEKPRSPTSSNGEDDLDARSVRYLHRNIANWRITSRITNVSISAREICVDHTAAGRFPRSPFGDIQVEGNVWVFARFGGQWVAATYDWLKPGQVCKGVTGDELGVDQIRISPMDGSWRPRSGDEIGFAVSTRARDDVNAGEERTNIVVVRWP